MNTRRSRANNVSTARVLSVFCAGFAIYGYIEHNPNQVYCDNLIKDVEKVNCSIPANISCTTELNEYVETVNITCGNGPIDWANQKSAKSERGYLIEQTIATTLSLFSFFYAEKDRILSNIRRMQGQRADEENALIPARPAPNRETP